MPDKKPKPPTPEERVKEALTGSAFERTTPLSEESKKVAKKVEEISNLPSGQMGPLHKLSQTPEYQKYTSELSKQGKEQSSLEDLNERLRANRGIFEKPFSADLIKPEGPKLKNIMDLQARVESEIKKEEPKKPFQQTAIEVAKKLKSGIEANVASQKAKEPSEEEWEKSFKELVDINKSISNFFTKAVDNI